MTGKVLTCGVCSGKAGLLDVVDFNKSCAQARGEFLPVCGFPIYYALCEDCGFCFAPQMWVWTAEEFAQRVYNADYISVDPEYQEIRPRQSAAKLLETFQALPGTVRHLDYGGAAGILSQVLRDSGWNSTSYDPFLQRGLPLESLGQFELITSIEVFAQVSDVRKLMSDLRTLLAPGGMVLFSTGLNDGNIAHGQRLSWWYAAPRNGHVSLFSRKSLGLLASQNGFSYGTLSNGFHFFLTTVPEWARHLLEKP